MNTLMITLAIMLATLSPARDLLSMTGNPIRVFYLENGLQVVLKEQHEKDLIAVNAYVKGGSRTETPEISGLSHYYEHLIFRGGTARQEELETRKVFGALGTFYGYTSDDVTDYYIVTTRENLDEAMWRHADAVMNLDLTQEKVDRERQVVMEEYNMDWDRPEYRVFYLLMETAYKVHPYRVSPIGSKDVIMHSDLDRFRTFYEERYVPDQIVLACVGNFDTQDMLERIRSLWGNYPAGGRSFETGLVEPEQQEFREASLEKQAANSYMQWGFHIPEAAHPDIPALDALNSILTHGESSRLYRALKVDENLALTVTGTVDKRRDPGLLILDLTLAPENEKKVAEAIFREVSGIASNGVTPEELAAARGKVENDYCYDHQSFIDQAQTLTFYATNSDIVLEAYYIDQVRHVTMDDIIRVTRKYLRPTNCSIATVRPEGSTSFSFAPIAEKVPFPPEDQSRATSRPAGRKVLDNGLTLVNRPDFSANTVVVEVYVRGGLLAEDVEDNGICNYISRSLLKGTEARDAGEIARCIDLLGIDLKASSHKDFSSISLLTVPENLQVAVDLLVEVIATPTFPDGEISRVKEDIIARIESIADRSYDLTNREFAREIFDRSPYGMPVAGEATSVSELTREDLIAMHARLYVPANMVVAVVGAFTAEELGAIEKRFSSLEEGDRPALRVVEERRVPILKTKRIDLEKTQITFDMGTMGVGVADPDYLALKLVERVLSYRLFFKYVYEEGIAYRMWTRFQPGLLATPFTFEMGVSASNYAEGRDGILAEVRDVVDSSIPREEFERAGKTLVTRFYLGQETNAGRARNMAFYEMAGLGYDYPDRIRDAAGEVTLDQVNDVARRYLDPDKYTMVVVGRVPE